MEALAAHVAADPPSARPRTHRRLRAATRPGGRVCSPAGSAATLARCERCDAAVVQLDDAERWSAGAADSTRPPVCLACGAGRFANLRPGVSRLRRGDRSRGQPARRARDRRADDRATARRRRRSTSAPRPCCTASSRRHGRLPRLRPRAAGAAVPSRRAGDGAAGAGGAAGRVHELGAGGSSCRRSCPITPSCKPRCEPIPAGWSTTSASGDRCWGCRRSAPTPRSRAPGSDEFVASLPRGRRRDRRRRAASATSPEPPTG